MAHEKDVKNVPVETRQAPEFVLLSKEQRRVLVDEVLSNRIAKLN